MLEEIELGTKRAAAHLIDSSSRFEVTGLGIAPLGSIEVNRVHDASTWRYRMSDIIDQLNEADTGLLVTVDEVDPTLDEMIQLAATYQTCDRWETRRAAHGGTSQQRLDVAEPQDGLVPSPRPTISSGSHCRL